MGDIISGNFTEGEGEMAQQVMSFVSQQIPRRVNFRKERIRLLLTERDRLKERLRIMNNDWLLSIGNISSSNVTHKIQEEIKNLEQQLEVKEEELSFAFQPME